MGEKNRNNEKKIGGWLGERSEKAGGRISLRSVDFLRGSGTWQMCNCATTTTGRNQKRERTFAENEQRANESSS
jgi:hypothetical protein